MGLLERFRSSRHQMLPSGSQIGFRWPSLARQQRTGVGIDCGSGLLKVVQIRWTRKGPRLENYAIVPMQHGALEEGLITDPVMVGDLLRTTLDAMSVTQPVVGTCVGGPSIMMRHINLPRVSEEEMQMAMRFEAPQHLPVTEDQLIYDFTTVPEATGVPDHQMAVFLAGTHKRLIDSYTRAIGSAGLRLAAIELDCLAMLRVLQWSGQIPHNSQTPCVLIDFGETGTRISIFKYDVPILSRTIPYGLHHLRMAIVDTLQISVGEAEKRLRLKGVKLDRDLSAAVEPWLDSLTDSLGRSIEFFLIQNRGVSLERIFVAGGGAMLADLPNMINSRLNAISLGRFESEAFKVQQMGLTGFEVRAELLPGVNHLGSLLMAAMGAAMREGTQE